jgi:hypothetical protein
VASFVLATLALASSLTVLGPGALAPADAGVLENVQALRLRYGWGLEREAETWQVLAATESCNLLGYDGYAVTELGLVPLRVVDCQNRQEQPRMSELGLLADVNERRLGHMEAWLILWEADYGENHYAGP